MKPLKKQRKPLKSGRKGSLKKMASVMSSGYSCLTDTTRRQRGDLE